MTADPDPADAALSILDRFCDAFAERDADAALSLFAPGTDPVVVTSERPLLRGFDELERFLRGYAEGDTVYRWEWGRRDAVVAGTVAWLLAEGTEISERGDGEDRHPYRMTMVLELRGGRWVLRQVHGSSPHS
jgi:ketosteroid isomerase-like protein